MFTFFIADFEDLVRITLIVMDPRDYPYSNVTEKIIGCAMKVHSYFGLGFPELVYQKCLIVELEKAGLRYNKEVEKEIWYHNQLIGKRDWI